MEVFEAGEPIGSLTVEPKGLFLEIFCEITKKREQLRRIFVQQGWKVEYIGIPDKNGELRTRIPKKHLPEGIGTALATKHPRGKWLPWRGELDGVQVEEAYISPNEVGIDIALNAEEAFKFPAWAEEIKIDLVFGQEMALLPLTTDGHLPMKETEIGGNTDEEIDRGDSDFELPADFTADDGHGGAGDEEQGWETDRPDL